MQLFDLPLDQLQTYKPEKTAPKDFSEFWKLSLEELAKSKQNLIYSRLTILLTE